MNRKALLPYLHYFWAVAKHRSFTRAAEEMNVSQSSISYQVKLLEERLGLQLLDRSRRQSVRLTAAGNTLMEYCQQVFTQFDQILDDIQGHSLAGSITIAGSPCFGTMVLTKTLALMQQQYPALKVNLSLTHEFIDLRSNHIDLAIRNKAPTEGLSVMPLFSVGMKLIAAKEFIQRQGMPKSLASLQHYPIILDSDDIEWLDLIEKMPNLPMPSHNAIYVSGTLAEIQAAKAGLGLAYVPHYCVIDELYNGDLVEVLPQTFSQQSVAFYLCTLKNMQNSPKVAAVMEVFKSQMTSAINASIYQWLAD